MTPKLAGRVSRDAFEARYAALGDPWAFETSHYEQFRYQSVIEALSKRKYGVAYEPGCSIGVLTLKLAAVTARLIATDIAPSAVRRAKARCANFPNVEIHCENAATYVPAIPLDLVVFSEIGYYFETAELIRVASTLTNQLSAGGEFVAVHWLGHSEDHVLHGDIVHETLKCSLPIAWVKGERYDRFRIDCWAKS